MNDIYVGASILYMVDQQDCGQRGEIVRIIDDDTVSVSLERFDGIPHVELAVTVAHDMQNLPPGRFIVFPNYGAIFRRDLP